MMGELTDGLGDVERGGGKERLHLGPCMDLILFIYSTNVEKHVLKRGSPTA